MAGNPNWRKGGPSPNKSGRPRGLVEKRARVTNALLRDAEKIARVVSDAALEQDMTAASLVLARAVPTLKPEGPVVKFELDSSLPLSQQMQQVLNAMANGELNTDAGKMILDGIRQLAEVRATDELEARLAALEAKA